MVVRNKTSNKVYSFFFIFNIKDKNFFSTTGSICTSPLEEKLPKSAYSVKIATLPCSYLDPSTTPVD